MQVKNTEYWILESCDKWWAFLVSLLHQSRDVYIWH